jgi:hypothetical protein
MTSAVEAAPLECYGGPMDGARRTTVLDAVYFDSQQPGHVNVYRKLFGKLVWEGLAEREGHMQVLPLAVGERQ